MDLYIHSPKRLHGVVLNWLSTGTTILYLFLIPLITRVRSSTKLIIFYLIALLICGEEWA
jgi:hypothetical protein